MRFEASDKHRQPVCLNPANPTKKHMIILNEKKLPWREGMTITDLLNSLKDSHHYAVVRVNGKYVSKPHFDDYKISDKAEIYLIPMVAGG